MVEKGGQAGGAQGAEEGSEDGWAPFRSAAEEVLAACARGAQSAMPGAMLYAHHVGRLRFLAREEAAKLGLGVSAIEPVVAPYVAQIDELCGEPSASRGGSPGPGIGPPKRSG